MGDPKKKHKRYTTPKRPYDSANLEEELRLIGTYGLRNKKELWRHRTELSTLRRRAREMLSMGATDRLQPQEELIAKLHDLGLIEEGASLDDILTLSIRDLMERRLQTVVFREGMTKSLFQARQIITHGHIAIDNQKVKSPSYMITIEDEEKLDYAESSPFSSKTHPLRQDLIVAEDVEAEPVE
ncbi:MAG: 30S ribosomal protein S4 [Candidatus Bathyarchaeota archaeon]